jgi:hypothetical protein
MERAMSLSECTQFMGTLGVIDKYPDIIEYLEFHFSPEEMKRLEKEPIFFFLGADRRDQERIWNAIECRLYKRKPLAAE